MFNLIKVGVETNGHSKHGTFRPKLLQLVQSNDAATIIQATQDAFDIVSTYSGKQFSNTNLCTDALKALKILTALKGIGPATASLLLSIAVPGRIPFFSDELFRWCMWDEPGTPNGWKRAIKYNAKEYEALIKNVDDLVNRLGVRAVDAEKVAYVLGKEGADIGIEGDGERAVDSKDSGESVKDEIDKEPVPLEKPKRGTKRKATASKPQTEGTRKSARTKR